MSVIPPVCSRCLRPALLWGYYSRVVLHSLWITSCASQPVETKWTTREVTGHVGDSFTHLHVHTEYSMLDGAARLDELVAAAAADGQPALGITDHGNMYGVLDFYKACQRPGRQADHRHRGLHGPRAPLRAARRAGAASTTPAATPRAARSSTTT